MMIWEDWQIEYLKNNYVSQSYEAIGLAIGKTASSVRNKRLRSLPPKVDSWSLSDIEKLKTAYKSSSNENLSIVCLAKDLNRTRISLLLKASELGLCDRNRKGVETRKDRRKYKGDNAALSIAVSNSAKKRIKDFGHPKGMLGKKHSLETLSVMSKKSKAIWSAKTEDEACAHTLKAIRAKRLKYGSLSPSHKRGSWKAGWREIGGINKYYRSRWESNYARYLEWLKQKNLILEWVHEPETFWFENIKRGVRSYLPDFRVTELNGDFAFHEVKGWMDARSKTTIARFRKYYPHHKLIVIDGTSYNSLSTKMNRIIQGWEHA